MVKPMVKADGDGRPVFLFPAAGGTTSCYDELFSFYDDIRRPIYGLQEPYLCGKDDALTDSIEEWMGNYVAAIKSVQPSGPYTFIGYSQGHHKAHATAELLIKAGEAVDEIIVLDPNYPGWNKGDKVIGWDMPQVAKLFGIPSFIAVWIIGPLIKSGFFLNLDWSTLAKREKNVAKILKAQATEADGFAALMSWSEIDTGKVVCEDPTKWTKQTPKAQYLESMTALMQAQFPGLSADYVRKLWEVSVVLGASITAYKPSVMPKTTKYTFVWQDRSMFGLKTPYSKAQGFDRFVEGGLANINEVIIPYHPIPKENAALNRFAGIFAAFTDHFHFMHNRSIGKQLAEQVFSPAGIV